MRRRHRAPAKRSARVVARLLAIAGRILLAAVVSSIVTVVMLRWVPPPTSAIMLQNMVENLRTGARPVAVHYRWIGWEAMPAALALAVVAAEDQKFPVHHGFDFGAIEAAIASNGNGRLRGASTITQQVAKNLFLWPERSYLRKGLEAYFTLLLEALWPKQRILEVYLNIAEFGDNVYGAAAAARFVLHKYPAQITLEEAALLAAVLPAPKQRDAARPSPYVRARAQWIRRQMGLLGGTDYLRGL